MKPSERYRTWSKSRAPRLPKPAYKLGYPIHLTLAVRNREPLLSGPVLAGHVLELVVRETDTLAACVMPDHLHWIVVPSEGLGDLVRRFKLSSTEIAWSLGVKGKLWQRSFHDHIIRSEDELERTLRYIFENPVEAGLVDSAEKWPYRFRRGRNWTKG
jgi:REP element-mobilizing transposase RayT